LYWNLEKLQKEEEGGVCVLGGWDAMDVVIASTSKVT